jgi:ABC-2 type transport system permease protein
MNTIHKPEDSALRTPHSTFEGRDSAVRTPRSALLSAWVWLVWLSFRRMWWSAQSFVGVLLVVLVGVVVMVRQALQGWDTILFAKAIIVNVYVFLLPLLCLCYGTQSLGGDWEERSLVWLLTRPLSRPSIYLAKFLAALPWTLLLTVGGLALLGALAGSPGWQAVEDFWPAIALGTIAYLSLFQLLGAAFRRSTVIGVVYAFVLETLVGTMPGLVKRASIGFYVRCTIYDLAEQVGLANARGGQSGVAPEKASFYLPVSGPAAVTALVLVSVALLGLGMVIFARREYRDLT